MNKTTIYLDADEDITSVIDKVSAAEENIVALVPPKKMLTLQSAVNLKLLLKQSNKDKKKLVIITKDKALIPLAGVVGVHVAETLNSRPQIPEPPETADSDDVLIDDSEIPADSEVPVGILDKTTKKKTSEKAGKKADKSAKPAKSKKKTKFIASIPNFSKFRLKLFLIIFAVIALIVGWYVAYVVMPTADIEITAQTNRVPVSFVFELDETLPADEIEQGRLLPREEVYKDTLSATVPATGEKNVGAKATGLITVQNCETSDDITVSSGSTFTASGGYSFTTDTSVVVPGASFSGGGSICSPGEADVNVTAVNSGGEYNLAANTVYSSSISNNITAIGAKMSGGTDVIETVVAQKDLDDAAESLKKEIHDTALAELEAQFTAEYVPIAATFKVSEGKPTASPTIGSKATEVVVTLEYTYTMQGVALNSISRLIDNALELEIENTELSVFDNGLDKALFSQIEEGISLTTNGFVGPELDTAALAEEVSGKSVSEIRAILEEKPGVTSVTVDLQPLWVFRSPSADKISIEIKVSEQPLQ